MDNFREIGMEQVDVTSKTWDFLFVWNNKENLKDYLGSLKSRQKVAYLPGIEIISFKRSLVSLGKEKEIKKIR